MLRAWDTAGPHERRQLLAAMHEYRRARRFAQARSALITFDNKRWTLAEIFVQVIEPALAAPPLVENERADGITHAHLRALDAIRSCANALAPPAPVRAGTLNLFLELGITALDAHEASLLVRVRFFREAMTVVRDLDGRAAPDAWTRWLVAEHVLPRLQATARGLPKGHAAMPAVREAAGLLFMPSLLDERSQARLAPLTRADGSLTALLRFYRRGALNAVGRTALARTAALESRSEPSFLSSSAPLFLELLSDPHVDARERGDLVSVVRDHLAKLPFFDKTCRDLVSAALGGPPPRTLDAEAIANAAEVGVARPPLGRKFRFLRILLRGTEGKTLSVVGVIRRDASHHEPLYQQVNRRERRFVGVLLPGADGSHADFIGPPPQSERDRRLLRRRLDLERVSIRTFGGTGEWTEVCLTLPDDDSEPVPAPHAEISDVLRVIKARARRTADDGERVELVRLLARIGTDEAIALAAAAATTAASLAAMLPIVERGNEAAGAAALKHIDRLDASARERLLAAVLLRGRAHRRRVLELCAHKDVGVAVLAGEALLSVADARGLEVLLQHENVYVRLCGASLALRLTKLAGGVRITAQEGGNLKRIAELVGQGLRKQDGVVWGKTGAWAQRALLDEAWVRTARRSHEDLWVGKRQARPAQFAEAYARGIRAGKSKKLWAPLAVFVLHVQDPGRGMQAADFDKLLDAMEYAAPQHPPLAEAWRDALVALVCVQSGIEIDPAHRVRAHKRLRRLAGKNIPAGVERKPLYWAIWAAEQAAKS